MEKLSIIITTQNRQPVLEESIACLFAGSNCTIPKEVIVVDDGSTDGTPGLVRELKAAGKVDVIIQNDIPRGPATARNHGIQKAGGEYSLIMGDDVLFFPDALPAFIEHITTNGLRNASVIGNIMPHPEGKTAFEHWSCFGGSQFGHNFIPRQDRMDAGDQYFYTSNVVSKTEMLLNNPFNESFPYPRYEDRELGYRLKRTINHKVHYLPHAKSYHKHRLPFHKWLTKFKSFTWSALHFSQLYPQDRELREKVGVVQAVKSGSFTFGQIAASVEVINTLHTVYLDDTERFGLSLLREQLENAFRTVQEFFRMNYLRRHLRLDEMSDPDSGTSGRQAMKYVLTTLEKEA